MTRIEHTLLIDKLRENVIRIVELLKTLLSLIYLVTVKLQIRVPRIVNFDGTGTL